MKYSRVLPVASMLILALLLAGCMDMIAPDLSPLNLTPLGLETAAIDEAIAALEAVDIPARAPNGVNAKIVSAIQKLHQAQQFLSDGKAADADEKLLGAMEQLCGGAVPQIESLRCSLKKGRCIPDDEADAAIGQLQSVCQMIDDILWPPPVAILSVSPSQGTAPLAVEVDGSKSYDPDGTVASYQWDLGDGSTSDESSLTWTYGEPGEYEISLTVTDNSGKSDTATATVIVEPVQALYVYYGTPGWTPYSEERITGWLEEEGITAAGCDLRVETLPDVSPYDLLVVHITGGRPSDTIPFQEFLEEGKGVVILEATLFFLGGYPAWSGASGYRNGSGQAKSRLDYPFGTSILTGQVITGEASWGGPAGMSGLRPGATEIARWTNGAVYSYAFPSGDGRVFYEAQFGGNINPAPRAVELFMSGARWALDGGLVACTRNPRQYVYVSNRSSNSVSMIDLDTDSVVLTIPVGTNPAGVTPTSSRVYVANAGSNSVSVIDRCTNTVLNTIPVGRNPTYIRIANGKAYVTNQKSNSVSVIDLRTETVVATIPVGAKPYPIEVSGKWVLVAHYGSNSVSIIDSDTDAVSATVTVGSNPVNVAALFDEFYVVNKGNSTVSVVDPSAGAVTSTIPVGSQPVQAAVANGKVYVTNRSSNSVSVIDAATHSIATTVNVGQEPWPITSNGDIVCVGNMTGDSISVIDSASDTVLRTLSVGDWPHDLGSTPGKAYAASYTSAEVYIIDLSDITLSATIPVGVFPFDVQFAE